MNSVINKSPYFVKMTPTDLVARNSNSINEYKKTYKSSLKTFTYNEKNNLNKLILQINNKINKYTKITNIPWKLAKISNEIELSFPHTLEDVIIITDRFFEMPFEQQKITLLHEKIHIYQRLFPIETEYFIMNILDYQIKKENIEEYKLLKRNNPDLNDLVYGKEDYYIVQLYNSFKPESIADSKAMKIVKDKEPEAINNTSNIQVEHPYEIMASYLPYIIFDRKIDLKIEKWIKKYL
jgi:hypothetical protein